MATHRIEYTEGNTVFEGYCAYQDTLETRPGILVFHDWSGRNDFVCNKAETLAEMGYVAFAVDMYGKGVLGDTREEKLALMEPLVADRPLLLKRIYAAFEAFKKVDVVDKKRIGAMGYCFGGLCALDLARSGADVKGVATFHAALKAPKGLVPKPIAAKILVLHGYADPMVPPEDVINFGNEMTAAHADWECNIYGNAMHAFAVPSANDIAFGKLYNRKADLRSWIAMQDFFEEVFEG